MAEPMLLTRLQIERDIAADVVVYGIPTIKGMDKLIDVLVMLRNSWRELNGEPPYVNYSPDPPETNK